MEQIFRPTMMLSDPTIVDLAAATYDATADWDYLYQTDNVYCGVKNIGGFAVAAFRGSITPLDWLHDLEAVPFSTLDIGMVHSGFYRGIPDAISAIMPNLKFPLIVTGHSLGAAHAALFGGVLTARGVPVCRIVLCGCPRPGFAALASILSGTPKASYKNRFDPVTDVPTDPPFEHIDIFKMVNVEPPTDDIDLLADHAIFRYQQGVRMVWA